MKLYEEICTSTENGLRFTRRQVWCSDQYDTAAADDDMLAALTALEERGGAYAAAAADLLEVVTTRPQFCARVLTYARGLALRRRCALDDVRRAFNRL